MYCGDTWKIFWSPYNSARTQIQIFFCILGCLTNILNLVVFTRIRMRTKPTNTILSALAVTDFLCTFRQLVDFVLYAQPKGMCQGSKDRLHIAVEFFVREICFYIFHAWSIYLTLTVAIWRFIGVIQPLKSRHWLSPRNSKWAVLISFAVSTSLIPLLFVGIRIQVPPTKLSSVRWVTCFIFQSQFGDQLFFWAHGLLIKLFPCALLTIVSIGLVLSLTKATNRRHRLINGERSKATLSLIHLRSKSMTNFSIQQPHRFSLRQERSSTRKKRQLHHQRSQLAFHRTTKMICVFLIIFIFTEMPTGILQILAGLIDSPSFYSECLEPVGHFLNLNEYLSSILSMFVYTIFSLNFRHTLIQSLQMTRLCNMVNRGESVNGGVSSLADSAGKFDEFPLTSNVVTATATETISTSAAALATSILIEVGRESETHV